MEKTDMPKREKVDEEESFDQINMTEWVWPNHHNDEP